MNMEWTSYVIGGSFGLFLSIQYIVFYLFLIRSSEVKKFRSDLLYIILIGVFLCLFSMFGLMHLRVGSSILFRFKLAAGVGVVNLYVLLMRQILVSIKDLTFVETDGYKFANKRYALGFSMFSIALVLFILLFPVDIGGVTLSSRIFTGAFLAYLLTVAVIEAVEFLRIISRERGKITPINMVRHCTIFWSGILSMLFWGAENVPSLFLYQKVLSNAGSFYMYGMLFFSIGLSMNLIFEYMEVMTRVSETNRKLSDLNRKMMEEIRTAQSLQISLLPLDKQKDIRKYLDMEISYMPMQSVGGDYYDFYVLDDNRVIIFLGDASGHGIYAAMIWAMLKVEVEEMIEEKQFGDIAAAFTTLNKRITRILENTYSYATLFCCMIDPESRHISYISAGHTDQLLYSSQYQAVNKVRNKNPIIGSFKNAKYTADSLPFGQGDAMLFFSDGITEGTNPDGEQLGLERLMDMFLEVARENQPAADIISNLLMKLEDFFEGSMQKDDRTIMVIKT
jgi:serine phosphatase RsbU (regulator of sigma subunit)